MIFTAVRNDGRVQLTKTKQISQSDAFAAKIHRRSKMKKAYGTAGLILIGFLASSPAFARGARTFSLRCHGVGLTFGIEGISSEADGVVVTDIRANDLPVDHYESTTVGELGTTDSVSFDFQGRRYNLKAKDLESNPQINASIVGSPLSEYLHCDE